MGRTRTAGPQGSADGGMTLVELVVAMVVLATLAVAVLGLILQSQSMGVSNRSRIAAANLAAREIDIVREEFSRTAASPMTIANAGTVTNPHPLPGQTGGDPLVIDGKSYTVTRSVAWNVTGDGESACSGGSLVLYPTLRVTVAVTWPGMGSVEPVVSTASLAPKKDDGVQGTASFVAVQVTTSRGAPNPGRTVRVTSASENRSALTDSSGCAVVQVSPAAGSGTAYTAQVSDLGYVDISGTPAPTKAVGTLARGQLNNSVTFAYDRAGTLELRFVDETGAPVPDATVVGTDVTLVASEYSGASGATVLPVTGASMTVTGLWPTEYGAYAGTTAPGEGYPTVALGAGATESLDVPPPAGEVVVP